MSNGLRSRTLVQGAVAAVGLAVAATAALSAAVQDSPPQPAEPVLGTRSSIRAADPPADLVLVEEGARLHRWPDPRSELVAIAGAAAPRAVLERVGSWALVRIEGQAGWVAVSEGRAGPEVHAAPAAEYLAGVREPLEPDSERLARARSLLGDLVSFTAGPFTVLTDLADGPTLEFVEALLAALPGAYSDRFGLETVAEDRFAVLVFAREEPYRTFEADDSELSALETSGHAAGNVAVAFAEGRTRPQLAPILLHETTHLLNRSVFRAAIPAWLEEGLAEDLSFSHVDLDGRLDPGRLGGEREQRQSRNRGGDTWITELWGAPASLERLVAARRAGRLLALPDLLSLSSREMVRIEGRPARYAQSAFFIRFLLDGATPRERQGLRLFLRQVAQGGSGFPEDLLRLLGGDWERLERRFGTWLVRRSRALAASP